jgi:hypothetical protein
MHSYIKKIRKNTFETNSSSVHSAVLEEEFAHNYREYLKKFSGKTIKVTHAYISRISNSFSSTLLQKLSYFIINPESFLYLKEIFKNKTSAKCIA